MIAHREELPGFGQHIEFSLMQLYCPIKKFVYLESKMFDFLLLLMFECLKTFGKFAAEPLFSKEFKEPQHQAGDGATRDQEGAECSKDLFYSLHLVIALYRGNI